MIDASVDNNNMTYVRPPYAIVSKAYSNDGDVIRLALSKYAEMTPESWTAAELDVSRILIDELISVTTEASGDNWDGTGAAPVNAFTVQNAAEFICSFPSLIPRPELDVSPQGDVSFDWIQSRERAISVGVSQDRMVSYAWVNGGDSGHGSSSLTGVFDPNLYQIIQQVLG